ncbi:MAG: oligosaccharide flippase family protein [bacterium]|nr:oligosaccharide flippase family protein [bacterium]
MKTKNPIKRLISESSVYGLSTTLTRVTGVLLIPVYTRLFAPDEYGVIALLTSMLALFTTFLVLGLDNASARWYYDDEDITRRKNIISSWFWCQFSLSLIACGLLFISAERLSLLLFDTDLYTELIRLISLSLPLASFFKVCGNLLRYQRRAWTSSAFHFADSLITIGIIILMVVFWKMGLRGIYLARLTAAGFTAVVAIALLKGWLSPFCFSFGRLKEMLRFSLPLVPAGLAIWVRMSSDRFIIQLFQSQSEVGLYTVAFQVASAVALFTTAFGFAYGPFAFSILKEEQAPKVYAKVFDLYAVLGILLVTSLSLFVDLAFQLFTTKDYYAAAVCVPPLAYSFVVYGALTIASLGPSIVKQSGPVAKAILIAAGLSLAFNFSLVPLWGKEAASYSNLIASLSGVIYLFAASQKRYRIEYRFLPVITLLIYSCLVIWLGYYLPSGSAVGYSLRAVLSLSVIPAAMMLKLVSREDLLLLKRTGVIEEREAQR